MPAKKTTQIPQTTPETVQQPAVPDSVPTPIVEISDPRDSFFLSLFNQYPGVFDEIVQHKKSLNIQIIYTRIDRDVNNKPHFTQYRFNEANAEYFYPASTVKLPIALLALQKINDLRLEGFDKYSTMITEVDFPGQTAVYNDPTTPQGKPNVAQYIKKIFLTSDNDAFNRLYEFLGQDYINEQLHEKGFGQSQILHRLSVPLSTNQNKYTNPINFYDAAGKLMLEQPMKKAANSYTVRHDVQGKGHIEDGKLVEKPMDFSNKNRMLLEDLHQILTGLIFPNAVPEKQRFRMSESDRNFVLKYMSQFPSESVYPSYPASYPDASLKFLLYGAENRMLPKSIRIFNKSGDAYGQLTDLAYITDFEHNIEFLLSASILCNSDGILNDDHYDYETIGLPFMKNLGKAIYQMEAKRKKTNVPDLNEFRFSYDK